MQPPSFSRAGGGGGGYRKVEFEKQEGLTSSQQTITPASKAGEESSAFTEATDHDHKMDCAVEHAPGGY